MGGKNLREVVGQGWGGDTQGTLVPLREQCPLLPSPPALSECQGKLQELHRLLQSLESLHRIPSAPVIPTHQVRARGMGRECSGPLIPITSWGQACLLHTCPAVSGRFLCSICLDYCQHAAPLCPPGQSVRSSMVSPNSVTEITLQRARPQ